MKQLLYLVMSLVVIAAIIPAASATTYYTNLTLHTFETTFPTTITASTNAQIGQLCNAFFGGSVSYNVRTTTWIDEIGDAGLLKQGTVTKGASYTTRADPSVVAEYVDCSNGHTLGSQLYYRDTLAEEYPIIVSASNTTGYGEVFTKLSFTDRSLGDTIVWDYGDGSPVFTDISTPTHYELSDFSYHTYLSPGTYTVSITNNVGPTNPRSNSSVQIIVYPVNFTADITSGNAPLVVNFTSLGVSNLSSLSWSFGDGNITASASATISHTYQNQGTYTVIMGYSNASGVTGSVQKNNYITVGAPNATAITHAVARDLYTGFAIQNAGVDMYDVENTSWTNTTAINGGGSITTLLGHTINIWGSATGYEDDNLQGVPAVDGGYYSLLLRPTNLTTYNSTPGNLTLAVTVQDLQIPHQTLSGAGVTAAWGAQYASGTSNAAGSVFFTVPNNTAIHLSAFKSGYASGSSTHITGTANGGSTMETAIVYIGTDYVTPVPSVTATTGPGGTVPQTVDPYPCIGDGSPADTANCQRKQGSMAADLISYGPDLVKFFIMLTFIGGIMLLNKRR